jgi:hypothetical protein
MNYMDGKPQVINAVNLALIVGTIAAGTALWRGRIESPRPASVSQATPRTSQPDAHRIESRLWQDPFEAFSSFTNQDNASATGRRWQLLLAESGPPLLKVEPQLATNSALTDFWDEIAVKTKNNNIHVAFLGVMLPGESYSEDKEMRRRLRYAVELALLSKNLGPLDGNHISTNWMSLTDCKAEATASLTTRFAYEWFCADTNPNELTCVLWLNENDFSVDFSSRLGRLLEQLKPSESKSGECFPTNARFYLLGPRSSDSLRSLVEADAKAPIFQNEVVRSGRFQILSPAATAAVLGVWDRSGEGLSRKLNERFCGEVFHNWIATDQRMAELIAGELQNRTGSPALGESNVVAIITEQDSFYGRSLADALSTNLAGIAACGSPSNVWQFSYLRGLDGAKPQREKLQDQRQQVATTPEAALEAILKQQQDSEKANGDAQLDYIVRLGELLKEKDKTLRIEGKGRRIIGVGLTGSDAYDKLILLRGLRDELPEAVFFTTDLDATLWTADQLKYSRNLLVASAYPLEPNPADPDQQFPPFRDVYQRAMFGACQAVVNHYRDGSMEHLRNKNLGGGIYKIGRYGPVYLSYGSASTVKRGVLPVAASGMVFGAGLMFLIALVGGFWVPAKMDNMSRVFRDAGEGERERRMPWWVVLVGAGLGAVFVLLASVAKTVSDLPGEEPWAFLNGVSIWPCEFLRMLAAAGGILFLWYAYRRHQLHRKRLWREYFGKDWTPMEQHWKGFWDEWAKSTVLRRIRRLISARAWDAFWESHFDPSRRNPTTPQRGSPLCINSWRMPLVRDPEVDIDELSVDAETLFKIYVRRGLWLVRLVLSMLKAIAYVAILVLASSLTRSAPTLLLIRGPFSHLLDFVVLMAAVLICLLVLFYMLDAARLTGKFLDSISHHPTRWPAALLKEKAEFLGIEPKHLDGWIDVDFAAMHTEEVGGLMVCPFLLQFLLFVSRSSFFDTWTWPMILICIFVINFILAVICWAVVRQAAREVRRSALNRLEKSIASVENAATGLFELPVPGGRTVQLAKEDYLRRLSALRERVQLETRGAYAQWFQDPSYIGVFIPTGITGLLSVIVQLWLNK